MLQEYEKKGIASELMKKAFDVSANSCGIVTVTYEGWTPVSFFERYGFQVVDKKDTVLLMLLKFKDTASMKFLNYDFSKVVDPSKTVIKLVMTGRCPWIIQNWRFRALQAKDIYKDRIQIDERFILHRKDAMLYGEENIYIDNIPYNSPQDSKVFLEFIDRYMSRKFEG